MKVGREGYVKNTKAILNAATEIKKAIKSEIPEVLLASHYDSCVVTMV
jgi:hypothetical protein